MKNKLKFKFIVILTVILCLSTAVGCTIGMPTLEDILQTNDLTAQITYFANGGWFNEDNGCVSRNIYYKENSKALEITGSTATKIRHTENLYSGWWTVATVKIGDEEYFVCDILPEQLPEYNENGQLIIENDGKYLIKAKDYVELTEQFKSSQKIKVPLLALGEPFDFSNYTLKNGDNLYLVVNWIPNQKVEYVLLLEDCDFISVKNSDGSSTDFNQGDIVKTVNFDKNKKYTVPTDYRSSPIESESATFIDYYAYEENADLNNLTRLADVTGVLTAPEDGSNVKIYVKYTAGEWKVLRTAKEVTSMFISPNNNYYLSQDIDCKGQTAYTVGNVFKGHIRGNGHTISNLTFTASGLISGDKVAIFGEMTKDSKIENLNFKNTILNCAVSRNNTFINLYLICYSLRNGEVPTISNLAFDGLTISVELKDNCGIENIPFNTITNAYDASKWIYAGSESNEEFLSAHSVTVDNYQISINENIIATNKTEG